MIEVELVECMFMLLGFGELGGSVEIGIYDVFNVSELLKEYLLENVIVDSFVV